MDRIRLSTTPPQEIPPQGYVDIYFDRTAGMVLVIDSSGNKQGLHDLVLSVAGRTGAVTIASADITDATSGDDSSNDSGKLAEFGSEGELLPAWIGRKKGGQTFAVKTVNDNGKTGIVLFSPPADPNHGYQIEFPSHSGIVGIVGDYQDNAAALAAGLEAGVDLYWDDTENKLKLVQAGD